MPTGLLSEFVQITNVKYLYNLLCWSLWFILVIIALKRSCGNVMFLHLSVILFTGFSVQGSLSGGLCLGGFLSRGSLSRAFCPGGSLSGGSLSMGVSVQWGSLFRGSLSRGISVQWGLSPGGISVQWGSLTRWSLSRVVSV